MIDSLFSSPRAQKRFFWVSAGVLAVGLIAFVSLVLFRGTGNAFPDKFGDGKVKYATPEHHRPITQAQLTLARKFIRTAVLRKNLDSIYDVVNVDLKGRLTRKQWDTGNIPVVDYPAGNVNTAHFDVVYSYQNEALLEIDLVSKPGSQVRPELLFFLGLKRAGAKGTGPWQVSYWEPNWKPPIPQAPN
jgi:hypothetical protein